MYTEKILIEPIIEITIGPYINPRVFMQRGNWTMVYLIIQFIICNIVIKSELKVFNSSVLANFMSTTFSVFSVKIEIILNN
jgi:hypothetical protein